MGRLQGAPRPPPALAMLTGPCTRPPARLAEPQTRTTAGKPGCRLASALGRPRRAAPPLGRVCGLGGPAPTRCPPRSSCRRRRIPCRPRLAARVVVCRAQQQSFAAKAAAAGVSVPALLAAHPALALVSGCEGGAGARSGAVLCSRCDAAAAAVVTSWRGHRLCVSRLAHVTVPTSPQLPPPTPTGRRPPGHRGHRPHPGHQRPLPLLGDPGRVQRRVGPLLRLHQGCGHQRERRRLRCAAAGAARGRKQRA